MSSKEQESLSNQRYVKSPCVNICALNEQGVCTGCFRTGDEISNWGLMSSPEKLDVLRRVAIREQRAVINL
jgi:predicted Fe-S protein YdhL (DUF1289 family)